MQNKQRVKDGLKYGIIYTIIIMFAGFILMEIFALPISHLFGLTGQTELICISAIRVISISFLFAGLNISYQGIYQALDSGIESLVISICRQILFILPTAWLLAKIADVNTSYILWLTIPIGESITAVIGTILLVKINKSKINSLD